ncbi:thioredoxin family protein [Aquabacterium sp.]|uniref:thioredoxin family protein n=1 Tax=Aquabacterium sp. TaxID=1872578 RepID=UPI002CAEBAF5|nr:thioredoxin family protein [Aquabacterium sp.]HSW06160.1 thioredoxin family protein [Aquabacterium sp.]
MPLATDYADPEPRREDIDAITGPTLLEFGTPWCGHCRAAQPLLEQALAAHPEVRHIKVEDASGRPLGRSFRVRIWPTLIFLRDGEEFERMARPTDVAAIARAVAGIAAAG